MSEKTTHTPESIKAIVTAAKVSYLPIRRCSICGSSIGYVVHGKALAFDGNCDCVSYIREPEPRSWDDLANFYNMQTSDDYRAQLDKMLRGEK